MPRLVTWILNIRSVSSPGFRLLPRFFHCGLTFVQFYLRLPDFFPVYSHVPQPLPRFFSRVPTFAPFRHPDADFWPVSSPGYRRLSRSVSWVPNFGPSRHLGLTFVQFRHLGIDFCPVSSPGSRVGTPDFGSVLSPGCRLLSRFVT